MTDSHIPVVQEADQLPLSETEVLQLSLADQVQLAEAILNPPEPTEALRQAF